MFVLLAYLFFASATGAAFSQKEATFYMHLNAISMCSPDHVASWDCGIDCDASSANIVHGSLRILGPSTIYHARGFVIQRQRAEPQSAKECIAIFAGTSFYDIQNIRADVEAWLTPWPSWQIHTRNGTHQSSCPSCKVHHGFASAYGELRESLFHHLQDLQCGAVAFTGHSFGAALATLASFDLRACCSFMRVSGVWTFASPRVGNSAFVSAYSKYSIEEFPPMWRVVRQYDLIPQLPPSWLGFEHAPVQVCYSTPVANVSDVHICTDPQACATNSHCRYAYGSMAYHHGYFGVPRTDEDEAPESCIPIGELQRQRGRRFQFLLIVVVLFMCIVVCLSVLCVWCCRDPDASGCQDQGREWCDSSVTSSEGTDTSEMLTLMREDSGFWL
ncbi:unnamed protein product [Prorocentrum cordatum]|uniref:Fungal lipase-type domain-containing protein n=1 Tax=Prorocentrum cordatum TaxID=2364126 RepID=A0ABN9TAH0_9DINO|nr:unnamed protein product [Polarella glacialis]